MASTLAASQEAFEKARNKFRKDLGDKDLYQELLQTTSIDQVWQTIRQVQIKQHSENRLRHLNKIGRFLANMEAYGKVVDTYCQVKPEIMGLVWGSLRVLILWASNVVQFAEAITNALASIGEALPQFADLAKVFQDSERLKDALVDFYGDILECYVVALKFFSSSAAKQVFQALWPTQLNRMKVLLGQIESHTAKVRSEATVQHIIEEHDTRAISLAHFDREEDFQQRQRFQNLTGRVSPVFYDKPIDDILNRSFGGSTAWLIGDPAFREWLDVSQGTTGLLWLRGIPGAGKTYLAANAIQKAKARHQTLFVLTSHANPESCTARSIIQSLLFQLAARSTDVQTVLVQENERELLGNTRYLTELFKKLLKIAGPAYLVLDGLDEMEIIERGILLQQIITNMDDCPQVRILVSSRPEDDIANRLESKATVIRVDKRNSGSIQAYVDKRGQDWIDNGGFDKEAQDSIKALLKPVAAAANGMFLYARIVLDSVELFSSLEEIEGELVVLPEDLNDAYRRIFDRIKNAQPALRLKASMILGWIACSPVSMTRLEMEQALLVGPESRAAPKIAASVNFVRICGPIVEMVDDSPRFVHFTVKEYIFSRQTAGLIDEAEANNSLAKAVLTYLLSEIYNEDSSKKQVLENVLNGRYRLHWFATTQWTTLARQCIEMSKHRTANPELLELLVRLTLERRNHDFEGKTVAKDAIFQDIAEEWPELSQFICGVLGFLSDERHIDWNYDNAEEWMNHDPSTLSKMSGRIHHRLERLLCNDRKHRKEPDECHCATLHRHYGPNLVKCTFPSCSSNRQGLPTHLGLRDHLDNHSRPYKCSEATCPWSTIGFAHKGDLYSHRSKRHSQPVRAPSSTLTAPLPATDADLLSLSDSEVELLLLEFVRAGDLDGMRRLAPCIVAATGRPIIPSVIGKPRLLAARAGSVPMLAFFASFKKGLKDWYSNPIAAVYVAAVRSGNPDLLRWILDRWAADGVRRDIGWTALGREVVATPSPEMYSVWEAFLLGTAYPKVFRPPEDHHDSDTERTSAWCAAIALLPQHKKRSVLFSKGVFTAVRKDPLFEARLIRTWHRLLHVSLDGASVSPRFFGWALRRLAGSSNPSLTLAAELLGFGAPVDFPRGPASRIPQSDTPRYSLLVTQKWRSEPERHVKPRVHKGMTSLHIAVRQGTEAGARLARFLLEKGAEPGYQWDEKAPAGEPGAKLMGKFLGESWAEVVARTRPAREAKGPGYEAVAEWKDGEREDDRGDDAKDCTEEGEEDEHDEEESSEEEERQPPAKRQRRERGYPKPGRA